MGNAGAAQSKTGGSHHPANYTVCNNSISKNEMRRSGIPRREHDDAHADQRHCCTDQVPRGWLDTVDHPEPQDRDKNIHTAVGGIYASGRSRVQGKQPGKQSQAHCRWQQQPCTLSLLEPQVRKITADDFSDGSKDENGKGAKFKHVTSSAALNEY